MSNYKVLLNNVGRFELIDIRDNIDESDFIAQTTSSWKRVVTAGQRKYHDVNHNIHNTNATYIFSYPDGAVEVVNPNKGDYVPPGFIHVSKRLEALFGGYDGFKCVHKSRLIPMPGCNIINGSLRSGRGRSYIYSNNGPCNEIYGWKLYHPGEGAYSRIVEYSESEGIKCSTENEFILAIQVLDKNILEGRTHIRVLCEGTDLVMIGTDILTREEDGHWLWEGDELTKDTSLTIRVGCSISINHVEILND